MAFVPCQVHTSSTGNRPDRRASASARHDPEGAIVPSGERERHLVGRSLARPPALTLSGPTMRHLSAAWEPGRRARPGVEISRDPRYTPARVMPDPARTVPNLTGARVQMR